MALTERNNPAPAPDPAAAPPGAASMQLIKLPGSKTTGGSSIGECVLLLLLFLLL